MARLRQLLEADAYRACDWDLKRDSAARAYWVAHFCRHLDLLAALLNRQYPTAKPGQLRAFRSEYLATMRSLDAEPEKFEHIDILRIDELRHDLLRRHGFEDPYRMIKQRENATALAVLPRLLAELDAEPAELHSRKLATGLLAGNLFDLGAPAAMERYGGPGADFWQLRNTLPARPWLRDDLDRWCRRWRDAPPYRHVLLFADNAGPDICLGCLPLVRWMIGRGSRVTLAANTAPALNDVTASELAELLARVGAWDDVVSAALAERRLAVVASGGRAPLIDLARLAPQCVAQSVDADLVILHGMGRAVESNFRARFACDALWVAVLKDQAVARHVGGKLFDCIFRFEQARHATERGAAAR